MQPVANMMNRREERDSALSSARIGTDLSVIMKKNMVTAEFVVMLLTTFTDNQVVPCHLGDILASAEITAAVEIEPVILGTMMETEIMAVEVTVGERSEIINDGLGILLSCLVITVSIVKIAMLYAINFLMRTHLIVLLMIMPIVTIALIITIPIC